MDSPSTGAAPTASSSASAILDKFNQLHRSIDDVRSDISRIQLETEQAHDAIHKLHGERDTLVVQTRAAEEERVALQPQVTEALEECDKVQQEHSQSVLKRQRVQQQLKRTKAVMEDERQAFLTQSRNFRIWCRQMQEKEALLMTTSCAGSDNEKEKDVSFVKAYSYVRRFQQPLEGDDNDNNNAADQNTIGDSNNDDDDNNNMDSWLMNENDDDDDEDAHDSELQHAKSLFRSRQQAFNKARLCLKDVTAQYEAKVEQENQQLQRHQQLQRQLERIQSDCAQMKHQMSEVQEATVEALEIGQGLQRDILRRQQQQQQQQQMPHQTPTAAAPLWAQPAAVAVDTSVQAPMHNPYVTSTSSRSASKHTEETNNNRQSSSHSNKRGRKNTDTEPKRRTTDTSSSNQLQHPHRAGRIRVDKQFTTSNLLDVIGGEEVPEGGYDRNDVKHQPHTDHSQEGIVQRHQSTMEWETTEASSSSQLASAERNTNDKDNDNEGDDEEEDTLFSYVAFSKKR